MKNSETNDPHDEFVITIQFRKSLLISSYIVLPNPESQCPETVCDTDICVAMPTALLCGTWARGTVLVGCGVTMILAPLFNGVTRFQDPGTSATLATLTEIRYF